MSLFQRNASELYEAAYELAHDALVPARSRADGQRALLDGLAAQLLRLGLDDAGMPAERRRETMETAAAAALLRLADELWAVEPWPLPSDIEADLAQAGGLRFWRWCGTMPGPWDEWAHKAKDRPVRFGLTRALDAVLAAEEAIWGLDSGHAGFSVIEGADPEVVEVGRAIGGARSSDRFRKIVVRRDGTAMKYEADPYGAVAAWTSTVTPDQYRPLVSRIGTLALDVPASPSEADKAEAALDGDRVWFRGRQRLELTALMPPIPPWDKGNMWMPRPGKAIAAELLDLARSLEWRASDPLPEHLADAPGPVDMAAVEACPACGKGVLETHTGSFGGYASCTRHPACTFIRRDGPPAPKQLPFEVTCPKNGDGHLVARRARRTGNVFYGCSSYPKCDFTTTDEPTGALHDAHEGGLGAVGQRNGMGVCLTCGAMVELPAVVTRGMSLRGGPVDPAVLRSPTSNARR